MTQKELYAHPGWQWCTSEGAELHTLLLGLETTFREKLAWLEEAETLSLRLQSANWKSGLPVDPRLRPVFEAELGPQPENRRPSRPKRPAH
jgi:hypothetical protein